MAKAKKKQKKDLTGLIVNVVVIALAVLTVCTLFMPIFKGVALLGGKELSTVSAKGFDAFTAAFNSETASELSDGANMLIGLKTAEEGAFVSVMMIWTYMLTVVVSVASLVFAVLNVLGMKFKLVNTVLGIALVVLAILAFVFTLVSASKHTAIEVLLDKETGTKFLAAVGAYFMLAPLVAGAAEVYKARTK